MKNEKAPKKESDSANISAGIDSVQLKELYESPKMLFVPLSVEERLMQCAQQENQCDLTPKAS